MNYNLEARNIIYAHTEAFISGINFECKDNHTLYDRMVAECAFILTEKLLDGTYTPMLSAMSWRRCSGMCSRSISMKRCSKPI